MNARITLASDDEKLLLTFYVNNLLNVSYRAHTLPAAQGATGSAVTWSDPLTVGASITSRWYELLGGRWVGIRSVLELHLH